MIPRERQHIVPTFLPSDPATTARKMGPMTRAWLPGTSIGHLPPFQQEPRQIVLGERSPVVRKSVVGEVQV